MQAAIRATPAERFPALDRFLALARDDDFNSPGWVADEFLALAFGPALGPAAEGEGDGAAVPVVHRIRDEPRE
jgi:hypothetical protein